MMVDILIKSSFSVIAITALLCLSACYDKQYPPYFRNNSDVPVHISIGYTSDHPPTIGTLSPHTNGGHAEKDLVVESIDVKFEGGPEYALQMSEIESLRAALGRPDFEVWLISESGVRLGNESDWERIIAEEKMK